MTDPDLKLHRERLLALRARLKGDVMQMEDARKKARMEAIDVPSDTADLSSDSYDQELTLSLLSGEKNALGQIDGALKRIEDGSFGQCEQCGMKIPEDRLEAIPYATLCVQCASQEEQQS